MEQKFYQRLWFKNTVLLTIPALISVLGALISLIKQSDFIKFFLILIISILAFIFIFAVFFYSNLEEKMIEENRNFRNGIAYFEREAKTANAILLTFSELSENWSKTIYDFADKVREKHKVSDRAWDTEEYFNIVCKHCKNMILTHCSNENSTCISVSFVSYREDEQGEKFIHMAAHSDDVSLRPNEYEKEEKLSESKHYYAELIRKGHKGIETFTKTDDKLYEYKLKGCIDLRDCTQYVAVPIYCSNNKLLGIFQVETKYNCIIEEDEENLSLFITNKIIPYSKLIVLIDKINKGLYVTPKKILEEG